MNTRSVVAFTAVWLVLAAASCAPVGQVTVFTKDNAPAAPKLEALPLKDSVSQSGITWTFDKPVRVGQFIGGDWYVVGEVTVIKIDPKPLFGKEVADGSGWSAVPKVGPDGKALKDDKGKPVYDYVDIDKTELEEFGGAEARLKGAEKEKLTANPNYCRNGSVLNLKPSHNKAGFDSRVRHEIYDPSMPTRLPIAMKPGEALVSTISKHKLVRGKHYGTTEAVAVLTCLKEPVPADAFRPGYTDPEKTVYLARDLKRDLLPKLKKPEKTPDIAKYIPMFNRPWLEDNMFHETHAPYQFAGYGQGLARNGGDTACLLCLDFTAEQKEPLLLGYVQFGIDLYGYLEAGFSGWEAYGGWNSGNKHPIVLAGVLLGDDQMAYVSKTFPKASFQEDEQTGYGRTWIGVPVIFLGHDGIVAATGQPRTRGGHAWGPYEHLHPSKWTADNWQSEGYRRCCTSRAWVGTAIAARLMKLEKYWAHDAFFDYEDRWMSEDETEALKVMADLGKKQPDWSHEGQVEIPFHEAMWKMYRPTVEPPVDAWKKKATVDSPWAKPDDAKPGKPAGGDTKAKPAAAEKDE